MIPHHTLWADKRMADAYDLIADVVHDHSTADDKLIEITDLLSDVEKADNLLAGILRDRTTA